MLPYSLCCDVRDLFVDVSRFSIEDSMKTLARPSLRSFYFYFIWLLWSTFDPKFSSLFLSLYLLVKKNNWMWVACLCVSVTAEGFSHIANLHSLTELNIGQNFAVSDNVLSKIARSCLMLRYRMHIEFMLVILMWLYMVKIYKVFISRLFINEGDEL